MHIKISYKEIKEIFKYANKIHIIYLIKMFYLGFILTVLLYG